MNQVSSDHIRQNVRNRYKEIALQSVGAESCCAPANTCCESPVDVSSKMGYHQKN
ncbi:hypothetical protein GNP92_11230 [Paenibacillus timonensis]|nr:hypothetical protein [Paenibacillus timonensis]MUG86913.1 hypothetical protein [Paenibacillus timonensis]